MAEGIVVDRPPVTSNECGDKQDEGTLRLVEVSYEYVHETEPEAGDDDYPRSRLEFIKTVGIEIIEDGAK